MTEAPARSRRGRRTTPAAAVCVALVLGLLGLAVPASAATTVHVTGHLTVSPTGASAGQLQVTASSDDGGMDVVTSSPDGTYALDLAPGTWDVCATPTADDDATWQVAAQCLSDDGDASLTILDGQPPVTGLDLQLPRVGVVSGTLTGVPTASLADVVPELYQRDSTADSGWSLQQTGVVTGSAYQLTLVPDGTYRLCFSLYDAPLGCFGGSWPDGATDVVVAGGSQSRNVGLGTPATLAGTVTSSSGVGIGYVAVSVLRQVTSPLGSTTWTTIATTYADSDGTWTQDLPAGTYRLGVDPGDPDYAAVFYPSARTAGGGTDVVATSAQKVPCNVTLPPGGSILGTVNLPAGDDAEPVQVLDADTGEQVGETGYAYDGSDFEVDSLPAGSYVVRFAGDPGQASYAAVQLYAGGASVPLAGGQHLGLATTTLALGGTLTGTVQDVAGSPLGYATVQAYRSDGSAVTRSTDTDTDGTFALTGLSEGSYLLRADGGSLGVEYFTGQDRLATSSSAATPVATHLGLTARVAKPLWFRSRLGAVMNTAVPMLTGTSTVRQVLTAGKGSWSQPDATFSYQWLRDGVPAGAPSTSPTRTLVPADANHRISVRVIAAKEGYDDGSAVSAPTATVDPGPLQIVTPPRIAGAAAVGQRLTSDAGAWSWLGGYAATYQWFSGGVTVPGATGSSYDVQPGDLGRQISVVVTVSGGALTSSVASAPTAPVAAAAFAVSRRPAVTGRAKVGKRLSARAPGYAPGGASVAYQWLRNGKPVVGAAASTYKLKRSDRGKRISVRVTLVRAGYATAVLTSGASGKVKR